VIRVGISEGLPGPPSAQARFCAKDAFTGLNHVHAFQEDAAGEAPVLVFGELLFQHVPDCLQVRLTVSPLRSPKRSAMSLTDPRQIPFLTNTYTTDTTCRVTSQA